MTRDVSPLTLGDAKVRASAPEVMDWLPEHLQSLVGIYVFDFPAKYVGRLTERTLYNYLFESDEVAKAVIYAVDGIDFALAEKYGDRTSYDVKILDKTAYGRLVMMMAEMLLEEQNVAIADDATVLGENNVYLAFTDGPKGRAVHIQSPRSYCGFSHLFETHTAYHLEEVPVTFVGWANPKAGYGKDRDLVIVECPDGTRKPIEGIEIAFIPKANTAG